MNTYKDYLPSLRAWFDPNEHKEFIVGRSKDGKELHWFYLPWQIIRKRIDDVVGAENWFAEYPSLYWSPEGKSIVKCRLTICGVSKEALGFDKSKEKWQGDPTEIATADAFRNAAEAHFIGAYLDDQANVIRYLWDNMAKLNPDLEKAVRRVNEQYKDQFRPAPQPKPKESGFLAAVAGPEPSAKINDAQKKRLWAIAKNLKLSDEQIRVVYKSHGFEHTKDILVVKYDRIVKELESLTNPPQTNVVDLYPANNNVIKQIRTATGHDVNWIFAQCRHYGCDRPGNMSPDKLQKLVSDMLVDFAVTSGVVGDRAHAITSVDSALNFAIASGQPILDTALSWLQRYQPTSVSR